LVDIENLKKKILLIIMKYLTLIILIIIIKTQEFGRETKLKNYNLAPEEYYLNHGSYGASTKYIINKQFEYINEMEKNPLKFMGRVRSLMEESRLKVVEYLQSRKNNIVLVESATNALSAILRSIEPTLHNKNTNLLYFDFEYGMVKQAIRYMKERIQNGTVNVIEITDLLLPINESMIINRVEKIMKERQIDLFVFDHITSFPSFILPAQKLIQLCKKYNVISIIDGAHAFGQININLNLLNPDFYFGNGHKV
jgi:selenocysteine lyase/cysteine desulfurase